MKQKTLTSLPRQSGFTLIELLIVIAIISIITAAIGGNFLTSRLRARDAERKSALAQIRTALELYFNDYGYYPEETSGKILGVEWGAPFIDSNGTAYMPLLPSDKRAPEITYLYEVDGDSGVSTDQLKYRLYAVLENEQDTDTDLDGDGDPGNTFNGSVGDGSPKYCGVAECNYGIASPTTTLEEQW